MTDKSVVIVIPIYKDKLSPTEVISLKQLNKILGKYPRVFVAPKSLNFDYGGLEAGIRIEYFEDKWFQSTTSYSCLLLQKDFYERFADYGYMLLYQLDVFVFSDRLMEFCDMGFDYVGAPIERLAHFWHAIGARVGNGGFSLRRIPAVIHVLDEFDFIVKDTPFFHVFTLVEDIFFAYCGVRDDVDFKAADIDTALEFSVQENIRHVYRKFKTGWRPFGCHGWNQVEQDFWWPIIEENGYRLPPIERVGLTYIHAICRTYLEERKTIDLQPAWGWLQRGEISRLENFFRKKLLKFPEDHATWNGRLEELTLFWCAASESVLRGKLPKDTNLEQILEAVRRAMLKGESKKYLWEMWDRMLPVLGKEPYPVRDRIIQIVLSQKLEKYVLVETEKIDRLYADREQMSEREYSIERQVRLQAGQRLFEKALEWNISTEIDVWKRYTNMLMAI